MILYQLNNEHSGTWKAKESSKQMSRVKQTPFPYMFSMYFATDQGPNMKAGGLITCARLIYQQPRSCHVTPLLIELHWLSVADRITFKTLLCVYKSLNGLCPQNMFDCLVVNTPRPGSVTTCSSHHSLNLKVPIRLVNVLETGSTRWQLPHYGTIYLSTFTIVSFKTLLKMHLVICVYNGSIQIFCNE